jgi:DNA mismatch repair protein MutH
LKPYFTLSLYRAVANPAPTESLLENLKADPTDLERALVDRFHPFIGKTVNEGAIMLGLAPSDAKSYAAAVARRIFGAKGFKTRIREFDEMGITPRITRVDADLMPYEATSFPAFRYRALIEEDWDDSDLLARIEYMLFVPVHGRRKDTSQGDCTFGQPVFWRPSTADLDLIRREWELYRLEVERGLAKQLTPASDTVAIHVRPHARDSRDTDDAPGVGRVVKKSFWLNRAYVRSILSRHPGEPPDQRPPLSNQL